MSAFPWLVYGHRGAPAEYPENTLPSFRRALDVGATALETDVHLTRDGVVVTAHDPDLKRTARRNDAIRSLRYDELRAIDLSDGFVPSAGTPLAQHDIAIPKLAEVLSGFPGVPINVDVKPGLDAIDAVIAVVRDCGAERRVRLASFSVRVVRRIRERGYPGPTGLARDEVGLLVALPMAILGRMPWAGRAAQVPTNVGPIRLDTKRFVEKCHALGMRVDFWTINDPSEALRLRALGADGVMTDDPARIVRALA
jgi:glycerophosphoryl diester phosphodiesterase